MKAAHSLSSRRMPNVGSAPASRIVHGRWLLHRWRPANAPAASPPALCSRSAPRALYLVARIAKCTLQQLFVPRHWEACVHQAWPPSNGLRISEREWKRLRSRREE